jgi:hypothetical protein
VSSSLTDQGSVCYNDNHRAGTDAPVRVSHGVHGVHGVHFGPDFRYIPWKRLKQARQLTTRKCIRYKGFQLAR